MPTSGIALLPLLMDYRGNYFPRAPLVGSGGGGGFEKLELASSTLRRLSLLLLVVLVFFLVFDIWKKELLKKGKSGHGLVFQRITSN